MTVCITKLTQASRMEHQWLAHFQQTNHFTNFLNISQTDNKYATATSLSGPWSAWADFAPSGTNTYNSQTNFILPVGNTFIYMGDRWLSSNLMASTYVWLPLTISGATASLPTNYINWVVDTSTGAYANGPSETSDEGEGAALSGGAKVVSCSGCSGSNAAGYIGGTSGGVATFNSVSSTVATTTTIRVKYEVRLTLYTLQPTMKSLYVSFRMEIARSGTLQSL